MEVSSLVFKFRLSEILLLISTHNNYELVTRIPFLSRSKIKGKDTLSGENSFEIVLPPVW